MSMYFDIPGYQIELDERVLKVIDCFRQTRPQMHEAGGILLGEIYGTTIHITKASTPNSFDRSSRFHFERDRAAAQVIVDFEFLNSDGHVIYLGEWHTHPEDDPTPSGRDRQMIRSQLELGKLNEAFILMLIHGRKTTYLGYQTKTNLVRANEIKLFSDQ
jgi:integrative and conjugative element protein (TIGR02256 family)